MFFNADIPILKSFCYNMRGARRMIWKSKKTFLVFLSVIFGSVVILISAKMAGFFGTNSTSEAVENDEWRSALSVLPGNTALTRVAKGNIQIDEVSQSATTTTDLISRRLIIEYALSQRGTATSTMSDEEAENIANILASEVKLPQKKQYTLSDLNISTDNNEAASILYKDKLDAILIAHAATTQKENELSILIIAMDKKDTAYLNKLKTKVALYQDLIKKLLALKTPSSVAQFHLHLVQSFETLRSATVGFQSMLDDPVLGIAALAEYRNGVDMLTEAGVEYRNLLFKN